MLEECKVYRGSYKGIDFKIKNWMPAFHYGESKESWTYYIYIHLGKIPDARGPQSYWLEPHRFGVDDNHIGYDYHMHPVLSEIYFHGGITWYSKATHEDFLPNERVIEVGCDFQHYWDEGQSYDVDYVLSEVKKTIDSFKQAIPDYKYWCRVVGGVWDKSEGVLSEDEGTFKSFKGIEWEKTRQPLTT